MLKSAKTEVSTAASQYDAIFAETPLAEASEQRCPTFVVYQDMTVASRHHLKK